MAGGKGRWRGKGGEGRVAREGQHAPTAISSSWATPRAVKEGVSKGDGVWGQDWGGHQAGAGVPPGSSDSWDPPNLGTYRLSGHSDPAPHARSALQAVGTVSACRSWHCPDLWHSWPGDGPCGCLGAPLVAPFLLCVLSHQRLGKGPVSQHPGLLWSGDREQLCHFPGVGEGSLFVPMGQVSRNR